MEAGKRGSRISVEMQTVTKGNAGGVKSSWTPFCGAWAAVRNISGQQGSATKAGGGERAGARTEFLIAYRAGITTAMRVRYAGSVYPIVHVNDRNEKHERIVLTCELGEPDA